jgi:hypothetical protein
LRWLSYACIAAIYGLEGAQFALFLSLFAARRS